MKYLLAAALLAAAWLLLGLPGPAGMQVAATAAAEAGQLRVSGSGTMAPLVAAMAQRFQELHPRVHIDVRAVGSGQGLSSARDGSADVGMVSRPLYAGEEDLQGLPIARDGVALVLHRDNPVHALSPDQVRGIYTGRIVNWQQVGGRDAPIFAIGAEPGRSSPELFMRHFQLSPQEMRVQAVAGDGASRLRLLREHPEGIVYVSVGEAERSMNAGAPIRLLPDNGVDASSRNVARGHYTLTRPLTLVTGPRSSALAKNFVSFCASSQVTDLILVHDFVPYLD